jgi:hypothetical protein
VSVDKFNNVVDSVCNPFHPVQVLYTCTHINGRFLFLLFSTVRLFNLQLQGVVTFLSGHLFGIRLSEGIVTRPDETSMLTQLTIHRPICRFPDTALTTALVGGVFKNLRVLGLTPLGPQFGCLDFAK